MECLSHNFHKGVGLNRNSATVSIIIPTYNRPTLLRSAVSSVLNQTFQDFEVIVVDDCSPICAKETLSDFADERIKVSEQSVNRGEAGARNVGIGLSRGEYIAFLDDDDEWLPDKLRLQVELLDRSPVEIGLVYTTFQAIDLDNSGKICWEKSATEKGDVYHKMLARNLIGTTSTVLLRRACLEKVGVFDESIPYGVDHDLWLRISQHFHFESIDLPLVKYSLHSARLSNNLELVVRGYEERLKVHPECIREHRKYYSDQYLFFGAMFSLKGDTKRGRKLFLSSIKLSRFSLRAYFNLILSFFGASIYRKAKNFGKSHMQHLTVAKESKRAKIEVQSAR